MPPDPSGHDHCVGATDDLIATRLRAAGSVFAEDEARLLIAAAESPTHLAAMVDQRTVGVPLEHLLGWVEFCGRRMVVDPGVFVPRRRTEFLVGQAAVLARPGAVVVDLCCGTGAVGVALLAAVGRLQLHAVDIEPAAVRCARRNVGGRGRVYEGDLDEPLSARLRGRVDVLVANAPYVPTRAIGALPPEARVHEPGVALDGGLDGLDVVRRVSTAAGRLLAPGGHVLVETSEHQAPHAADAFGSDGLAARIVTDHELNATVVIGGKGPGPSPE